MASSLCRGMPLKGVKVLELAGLAPSPFAGMILADFGASVVTVGRPGDRNKDFFGRGKQSIQVNLKAVEGQDVLKRLCRTSDVLIEPFRAGVMEKLGLGPEVLCEENSRLIYTRLNGFGIKGSLSQAAGHDINYLAISGILSRLGDKDGKPSPPINLLGDFAGGSYSAVMGILMALFERSNSGLGQVVETSITEGTAYVSSFLHRTRNGLLWLGGWLGGRGESLLDGGAPFYQTYETKDHKYMAVGAIEPQFYALFIANLGIEHDCFQNQMDISNWPVMTDLISDAFKSKTQEEWTKIYEGIDACVTPVLDMDEAALHPHNVENKTFIPNSRGEYEPSPAPTLSRTPGVDHVRADPLTGEHTAEVLLKEGFSADEIQSLLADGVIQQYTKNASL